MQKDTSISFAGARGPVSYNQTEAQPDGKPGSRCSQPASNRSRGFLDIEQNDGQVNAVLFSVRTEPILFAAYEPIHQIEVPAKFNNKLGRNRVPGKILLIQILAIGISGIGSAFAIAQDRRQHNTTWRPSFLRPPHGGRGDSTRRPRIWEV